jgi:hypothetical protein
MSALTAVLAAALAAVAAAEPSPPAAWILSCNIPPVGANPAEPTKPRVFRLAPKTFQEWKPNTGRFGTNLCQAYTCAADRGRLTGTVSSASVILTVSLDPVAGRGEWKATGASNLPRTQGVCTVKPEGPQPGA